MDWVWVVVDEDEMGRNAFWISVGYDARRKWLTRWTRWKFARSKESKEVFGAERAEKVNRVNIDYRLSGANNTYIITIN